MATRTPAALTIRRWPLAAQQSSFHVILARGQVQQRRRTTPSGITRPGADEESRYDAGTAVRGYIALIGLLGLLSLGGGASSPSIAGRPRRYYPAATRYPPCLFSRRRTRHTTSGLSSCDGHCGDREILSETPTPDATEMTCKCRPRYNPRGRAGPLRQDRGQFRQWPTDRQPIYRTHRIENVVARIVANSALPRTSCWSCNWTLASAISARPA